MASRGASAHPPWPRQLIETAARPFLPHRGTSAGLSDRAEPALLEQLVTTRSAITAGVTCVTLREREIALRTAAEFAMTVSTAPA